MSSGGGNITVGGAIVNDMQQQFGAQPQQTNVKLFSKLAISQRGTIAI